MTITSEIIQLIAILIPPVAAIRLVVLCWRGKVTIIRAGIGVLVLLIISFFLNNRTYTVFSIGIIRCQDGQRVVEVTPGIFSGAGDQQQCVPETLASMVAEQLALLRPTIMSASFLVVLSFCFLAIVLMLWRRRTDNVNSSWSN